MSKPKPLSPELDGIVFDVKQIGPLSEPVQQYVADVGSVKSLGELLQLASKWHALASDAIAIIAAMSHEDFDVYTRGMRQERRGFFAGHAFAEKYAAIQMPEVMFVVAWKAQEYKAPWGMCYIRMRDARMIKETNGVATIVRP